jgi:hypothetical protein
LKTRTKQELENGKRRVREELEKSWQCEEKSLRTLKMGREEWVLGELENGGVFGFESLILVYCYWVKAWKKELVMARLKSFWRTSLSTW